MEGAANEDNVIPSKLAKVSCCLSSKICVYRHDHAEFALRDDVVCRISVYA